MRSSLDSMIHWCNKLWTIIKNNTREITRTPLYRISVLVLILISVSIYLIYSYNFEKWSGVTSTFAPISPRFLVFNFGYISIISFLLISTFVNVKNAGTLYKRELNNVLVRPVSIFQLQFGSVLAIVATTYVPLLIWFLIIQIIGYIGTLTEPRSLMSFEWDTGIQFMMIESLIAITLWSALLKLIYTLCNSRLIGLIILLTLLMINQITIMIIPQSFLPHVSLITSFGMLGSDIVAPLISAETILSRSIGMWMVVCSLIAMNLIKIGRNRLVQWKKFTFVVVIAILSGSMLTCMVLNIKIASSAIAKNASLIEQEYGPDAKFNVVKISGKVTIKPGQMINSTLKYIIRSNFEQNLTDMKMMLNPGLSVSNAYFNDNKIANITKHGILEFVESIELAERDEFILIVDVYGKPKTNLQLGTKQLEKYSLSESQLRYFGNRTSIFENSYVGLFPSSIWYPMPIQNLSNKIDQFKYSLDVAIPKGWKLITNGSSIHRQNNFEKSTRYQIDSVARVDSITIISSKFQKFTDSIQGIVFEVHLYNVRSSLTSFISGNYQLFREHLSDSILKLRSYNASFDFEKFVIVEVPGPLQSYEYNKSFSSTRSFSGLHLISEYELPMANFGRHWDRISATGMYPESHKAHWMMSYTSDDRRGESLMESFVKSWYYFGACVDAEATMDLRELLHNLFYSLFREQFGVTHWERSHMFKYVSSTRMGDTDLSNFNLGDVLHAALGGGVVTGYGDPWLKDNPRIWEELTRTELQNLTSMNELELASRVLSKRYETSVSSLRSLESSNELFEFFRQLKEFGLQRECLQLNDLLEAAELASVELLHLIGPMSSGNLPRFKISTVKVIPETDHNQVVNYNILVDVYNDSLVQGIVYFRVDFPFVDGLGRTRYEPFVTDVALVDPDESKQFRIRSNRMPTWAWIVPISISENRFAFPARIVILDEMDLSIGENFVGVQKSNWLPKLSSGIVIDDLDSSVFSFFEDDFISRTGMYLLTKPKRMEILSVIEDCRKLSNLEWFSGIDGWCRADFEGSFGEYRRSLLVLEKGKDKVFVAYPTNLPRQGRWRLELHVPYVDHVQNIIRMRMPPLVRGLDLTGRLLVRIVSDSVDEVLEFDLSKSDGGWHTVMEGNFSPGNVTVFVGNASSDNFVVFDAIRWSLGD